MSEQLGIIDQFSVQDQAEIDTRFEQIIALIEINTQLDEDLQAEQVAELRALRDALLGELLMKPLEAFDQEFTLLRRLYEGRTRENVDDMGVMVRQFVTRNPELQKADLHFREIDYPSGSTERVVEVPHDSDDNGLQSYFIRLKGNELRIEALKWNHRVNIEPGSEVSQRLLREFFCRSIVASDLMYNRLPDEISAADTQALEYLDVKQREPLYYSSTEVTWYSWSNETSWAA